MPNIKETYDVVVVGAGHAGCEAALASARLGLETIIFTVSVESIAMMPCNPNIGGSSKGHLVFGHLLDRTTMPRLDHRAVIVAHQVSPSLVEIGRASCRERV